MAKRAPNYRRLREAAQELDRAYIALQESFRRWSEAVTTLHMAELALRDTHVRIAKAFGILNSLLPEANGNGNGNGTGE